MFFKNNRLVFRAETPNKGSSNPNEGDIINPFAHLDRDVDDSDWSDATQESIVAVSDIQNPFSSSEENGENEEFTPQQDGISFLNRNATGESFSMNIIGIDNLHRDVRHAFQDRLDGELPQFKHSMITSENGTVMAVNIGRGHFVDMDGNRVSLEGSINLIPITDDSLIQQLDQVRDNITTERQTGQTQPSEENQDETVENPEIPLSSNAEIVDEEPNVSLVKYPGLSDTVAVPLDSGETLVSLDSINREDVLTKIRANIPSPVIFVGGVEVTQVGLEGGYRHDISDLLDISLGSVALQVESDGFCELKANNQVESAISNIVRRYVPFSGSETEQRDAAIIKVYDAIYDTIDNTNPIVSQGYLENQVA